MSYDLYFPGADIGAVRAYLEEHGHEVGDKRAGYENEATGVYWSFSFGDRLAFNLNYYRPHVFGLEAERTVSALVEQFSLHIDDPQSSGMGTGPYTPKGFLTGWNAGNRFAHRAIASSQKGDRPLTLPAARNAGMWRWNFAKEAMFDDLMDNVGDVPPCFIPTVMAIVPKDEKSVKTCVIWDLDMAVAIPEVDLVVSATDDGLIAAPRAKVIALLARHSQWKPDREVGDGRLIGMTADLFDQTPADVQSKLRAILKPIAATRVSTDHVLDEELVAEVYG